MPGLNWCQLINFWCHLINIWGHVLLTTSKESSAFAKKSGKNYNKLLTRSCEENKNKEVTDESFGFSTGLVLSIANLGKMFLLLFSITPLVDAVLLNMIMIMEL